MGRRSMFSPMWVFIFFTACGCGPPGEKSASDDPPQQPHATQALGAKTMQLKSSAFDDGQIIPQKYTGIGDDLSPPLAWSNAPAGTKSFALICDDPDAPSRAHPRPEGPWVHWVIFDIAADVSGLPEGVPRQATLTQPVVARQGRNDFKTDNIGYRGPLPPEGSGPHRYEFQLYALDQPLELDPLTTDKKSLLAAMQGHILGRAKLMGIFERE